MTGIEQEPKASRSTWACLLCPKSVRSPPITSTSASSVAPSARARRRSISPVRAWRSAVAAIFMAVLSPLLVRKPRLSDGRALVGQVPLLHVHGETRLVEHRPAEAQALSITLPLVALPEDLQDPAGQVAGVARVHIAVEVEVGEKEFPVVTDLGEDALPVEVATGSEDEMEHVVHVAAVLREHENLGEYRLLDRDNEHASSKHEDFLRVCKPGLFNGAGAVVGGMNNVREEVPSPPWRAKAGPRPLSRSPPPATSLGPAARALWARTRRGPWYHARCLYRRSRPGRRRACSGYSSGPKPQGLRRRPCSPRFRSGVPGSYKAGFIPGKPRIYVPGPPQSGPLRVLAYAV